MVIGYTPKQRFVREAAIHIRAQGRKLDHSACTSLSEDAWTIAEDLWNTMPEHIRSSDDR